MTTTAGGVSTTAHRGFDAFDRLISDSSAAGSYGYDALDRVDTTGTSIGPLAYYGAGPEPVTDGSGTTVVRAPDGTALAARSGGSAPAEVMANAHGDVVAGVDPATGAVADSRSYTRSGT